MDESKIGTVTEQPRVVSRAAIVQLIKRDDVISLRVFRDKVPDEPGCTAVIKFVPLLQTRFAYMKPSPPVTSIFRTSGRGSKDPWPVNTGASRHIPSSTKNLDSRLADAIELLASIDR